MKVILLENVAKTGQQFEVVDVASGYAMNYLIPRKLARTATPEALAELDTERKLAEEQRKKDLQVLAEILEKVNGETITIKSKANEEGGLFAGIHKKEVADALNAELDVSLTPDVLACDDPIKELGEHQITIVGPENTTAQVTLVIESK